MSTGFRFGEWVADVRTRSLTSGHGTVRLEPKAMDVLAEMARVAPGTVSSVELMDRVWSGVIVGDGALYRVIAALRKALGDDSRDPRYIESIPRHGYRLLVPVRFDEATEPGAAERRAEVVLALRRFPVLTESAAGCALAAELAEGIGRHVGWSSSGFQVLRTAGEAATQPCYRLHVDAATVGASVRVGWELLRGPTGELIWTSDHTEPADGFPSRRERISELVAEGVVKHVRRRRFAEWDQDPESPSLGYWDLVLLSDQYRSMQPDHIEARRAMLRRALGWQPRLAAAHAAYADFLSWEVANGISVDARAALETASQEASTAVDIDSHDPYVLSRCGAAYSRTGDHFAGVELCRRAFALAPSTVTREALATALCFSGQPEEAIGHYRSQLETMPAGHVFQYGKIVVALVQSDQLDQALEYSQLAVIHFPKDYFCWGLRANLLAHFDEMPEAAAAFAQARALMPRLTLASLIDGTNRTYGRTSEQQDLLTGGLMRLLDAPRA